MNLTPWFVFAHVLGAIIAFGPTFAFPIIGRLGSQERQHANFATRVSEAISRVQVAPFAILQGITGVGIIISAGIDVTRVPWLMVAIVLYLITLGFAIFVQTPTVKKVIEMTSGGPPPGAAPGAHPAGASPGAPAGPPPELGRLIRRVQLGGLLMMALIVMIVFLMVVKPAF